MDMNIFKSKSFLTRGAIQLIILILLATLPLYGSIYSVIFLSSIFMYVIITVSWVMFSGSTGYISLATAAFFGVGIYASALFGTTIPLAFVIIIGGLASFSLALLVGALTLRLKGVYFIMFTFGLVQLILHFLLWWEVNITGTTGRMVPTIDNNTVYYIMLGIFIIIMVTSYLLRRSKYGLALRSIGENEEAASHVGVNVTVLKTLVFALSAFFIGATGAIMATRWTYIDPNIAFNIFYSFLPVLMAIFGGMGQLYGPVIGAAVFTYLEEMLITRFPYYYMLIFGIIMLMTILYLPDGLIGLIKKIWKRVPRAEQGEN